MKKLLILMIFLGGCVSIPHSPIPSLNPPTYSPPSYVTTTESYHETVKPIPLHHSLTNLSAHIAYDTLKFPVISDYLKQNPKAWIDIKYNRMTIYSLQKAICYSKVPVKIYDKDDVLVDNDFRKDPKSHQCNLPFINLYRNLAVTDRFLKRVDRHPVIFYVNPCFRILFQIVGNDRKF